jgi:arginase family enzyme
MLVRARAAEYQVRVTVNQPRSDPRPAECINLLRPEARQLGPLADTDDLAIGDSYGAVLDKSQRIAGHLLERGDVAIDEQPVPHDLPLGEQGCYGKAVSTAWPNLSELLVEESSVPVGLLGAPLAAGSVTPGACDRAPALLRQTLKRIGRYDVETGDSLFTPIRDRGDVGLEGLDIDKATAPIRDAVAASVAEHVLTLLAGGNNAITRPAVLGLGLPLAQVGLITLDAHFDMRDLDDGLSNGNPVRALMQDGLPGKNIAQLGLAGFANTAKMHRDAIDAGNLVVTIEDVRRDGIDKAVELAIAHMTHADAIVLDCDIDVIDRSQMPGAPGARPGGMQVSDFFWAVRRIAEDHRVRVIDLTEWDPSLDPTDLSALTAARWVAECVAGFENR